MTRVHRPDSPNRLTRRSTVGLAFTGAMLVVLLAAGLAQAVAVSVGYRDFAYNGGLASRATGDSPQSKMWFANGKWYGGLFKSGSNANNSRYHIWGLDSATQVWSDSGITVDPRDRTHADYLFDSAHNKLYVVSTKSSCTSNPVAGICNDAINVYRFTFVPGSPNLATRYTADAGFPVAIIGGNYAGAPAVSTGGAETVTIARDSLGQLFVAWTRRSATNAATSTTSVAYSTSDGNTASFGDETAWSAPFEINAGEDGQDNVSAIVAYGGNKVGIYYTDKHGAGNDDGLFKVHADGAAGTTWGGAETVTSSTSAVDNQANVKTDGTKVYVVIKTGLTGAASDQIRLFDRSSGGTWTAHGVSDVTSTNVRPQVAIDTTYNGGVGAAIVVMNDVDLVNGSVYYKAAPLTGAGALTFTTAGKGTAFIGSSTDNDVEDPTTTKQLITQASGLLVEAADRTSLFYLHNVLPLSDTVDVTGPVGTVAINNNPNPDSTKLAAVTLTISATDPNGVLSMRIANSADGTTCPTTGSPALLSDTGAATSAYATTAPWTLLPGDGAKRVCIQFLDHPVVGTGNWSVPVSDTITLDTTGPTGTATINGGDATTPIATVSVAVPATDPSNVINVRLSNTATVDVNGLLTDGTTVPYVTPQPWTLTAGDGAKTVYVQWQDGLGTWSGVTSDTITLDSDDTTYTAITPVRMLDSRVNNPAGITIFSHGVPQSFQITGLSGIPSNAVAITGNLTVTGQTASGFVTLGPDVAVTPTTSTINFPTGESRANGVFVPLDSTGKLEATYRANGSSPGNKKTHLVLDVTGYFIIGSSTNEYFPVTPGRFLDTRVNVPTGAHLLRPSVPYGFQVGGRTVGGTAIPADAVAITGNLTVTGQTKKGFLSLTPTSVANPTTSNLNFPVGDTRANNFTVKLGSGGILYVVYKGSGRAHAILDVTGYFRDDDVNGLTYVPLAPTRIVDSRIDQGIFNPLQHRAPKSFTVRGVGGVGSDADAFTGNVTITGQTKGGFVSVTPTPNANPTTSTINFPSSGSRANGLAAPINDADGKASAVFGATSGKTDFILDITGYFH